MMLINQANYHSKPFAAVKKGGNRGIQYQSQGFHSNSRDL